MIIEYFHHSQDYWSPFAEKVIFDGETKTISVLPGVTTLDIRTDLYSAWVWWTSLRDNSKFLYAIRYAGLDPIGIGTYTGDIYFLKNGWKLLLDLTKVKITGALYSDDFDSAYYDYNGNIQFPATVSALVNTISVPQNVVTGDLSSLSIPTALQNAAALLNAILSSYNTAGTVGATLNDLKDEAFGRWKLDPVLNTMTLYKSDGITVLKVFNLTTTTQHVDAFLERVPT